MEKYQIVKVFLASPMDLQNERQLFRKTILQINEMIGKKIGVIFEVVCWEDYVTPDIGVDAQDVVNKQINMDYDIFCGLFGNRIGTSTNRSVSGTVEEYERARLLKTTRPDLKIMCYFLGNEDNDDIAKLKKQLNKDGTLFHEINDSALFANETYKHFTSILLEISKKLMQNPKQVSVNNDHLNRSVAVAVISQNKIIIVKRNKNSKFGGGSWQIPGGKIEAGESSKSAGIREVKEELSIGIKEDQLEYIGSFSDKDISDRTKIIQIESNH